MTDVDRPDPPDAERTDPQGVGPDPGASDPERRRFDTPGRMLAATFRGRCPECGQGAMFAGPYGLKETCPVCGVRFERDKGSWLGASVMAYGAAVVALLALSLSLVPRFGFFEGLGLLLVAVAVVTVALVYRPAKGWFVWWMWAAGFVYRDDEPPQRRRG